MVEKEITTNIGGLKVFGPPDEIHKLANIYGVASCEYGHQIVEEIQGNHRDNLITELMHEQKYLEDIEKHLIDAIRNTDYYKEYSSKMSVIIDDILEEIEQNER